MILKKARLISILLTIFVVVLGGCGGSGSPKGTTGNPSPTSNSPSALTALSISQGSVQLMKNGNSTWASMQVGSTLQVGDIIRTGDSSKAIITFFDGSTIELEARTQIEVSSLIAGTGTGPTTILLKQQIGETISTVTKLLDPQSRYEIETPAAVAAVRGSMMGVKVDSLGRTVVTNLEGHITVTALGTEVSIPVGMQVTVNKGEAPGQPKNTTTAPPTTTVPPTTTPPTTSSTGNMTVSSTTGWQQTSFNLVAEQNYYVTYISGSWTVDYRNYPATGPEGCSPETDRLINPVSKISQSGPFGALLGRVGSGAIVVIGASTGPFKADASGVLSLRINDSESAMADNQGSLVVNISSSPFQAITIEVAASQTQAFEGDTIKYTYKVINHGASPLKNVVVSDGWSTVAVYQSGDADSNNSLGINETWTFTSNHTISHNEIGLLINTATVTASDNVLKIFTSSGSTTVNVKGITIGFSEPGPDTIIRSSQITLVGSVNDPSILKVTITQNGNMIGTFNIVGGSFSTSVVLIRGTNNLEAVVTKPGAGSVSARMIIDFLGS
jgi:uncharacterized repeat protein (TIGR01451 family)